MKMLTLTSRTCSSPLFDIEVQGIGMCNQGCNQIGVAIKNMSTNNKEKKIRFMDFKNQTMSFMWLADRGAREGAPPVVRIRRTNCRAQSQGERVGAQGAKAQEVEGGKRAGPPKSGEGHECCHCPGREDQGGGQSLWHFHVVTSGQPLWHNQEHTKR